MSENSSCLGCGEPVGSTPFCVSCGHQHQPHEAAVSSVCPTCKAATHGLAFCTHCGSPTTAEVSGGTAKPQLVSFVKQRPKREEPRVTPGAGMPSLPAAGSKPPSVSPRVRGRSGALLLAVFLLLGVVALGSWWLDRRDADPARAASPEGPVLPDGSSSSGSARSSASAPASPLSPSPTDSAPTGVTCWDNTPADTAAQCSQPAGVEGLAWVYPSFDRNDCVPAGHPPAKLMAWQCWTKSPDGRSVLIRYNEWQTPDLGWASYVGKGRSSTQSLVRSPSGKVLQGVWRFDGVNREGRVTLSVMYKDWPFSVSVEGKSMTSINDALKYLVRQRDAREMLTR